MSCSWQTSSTIVRSRSVATAVLQDLGFVIWCFKLGVFQLYKLDCVPVESESSRVPFFFWSLRCLLLFPLPSTPRTTLGPSFPKSIELLKRGLRISSVELQARNRSCFALPVEVKAPCIAVKLGEEALVSSVAACVWEPRLRRARRFLGRQAVKCLVLSTTGGGRSDDCHTRMYVSGAL